MQGEAGGERTRNNKRKKCGNKRAIGSGATRGPPCCVRTSRNWGLPTRARVNRGATHLGGWRRASIGGVGTIRCNGPRVAARLHGGQEPCYGHVERDSRFRRSTCSGFGVAHPAPPWIGPQPGYPADRGVEKRERAIVCSSEFWRVGGVRCDSQVYASALLFRCVCAKGRSEAQASERKKNLLVDEIQITFVTGLTLYSYSVHVEICEDCTTRHREGLELCNPKLP